VLRRRAIESGYTLIELAVTMTIMLVVAGGLLGALESGTSAERHASTRIDDEQALAVVLAQFTHDVRNATAVEPVPLAQLPTTLELVEPGSGSVYVRWALEPSGSGFALTRYAASSLAGTWEPGVSAAGLTAASVFDRQSADGTDLVSPPPAGLTNADAARCTETVEASIVSSAHPPSAPFAENVAAPVHATTSAVAASLEPAGPLDVRGCP